MAFWVMLFRVALIVIPFFLGWKSNEEYDRRFRPIRALIKRGDNEPPRIARIFRIRRGERIPVTEESLSVGADGSVLESGEFILEYEE